MKTSHWTVPLAMADGVPRCPECYEPMIEQQPGIWDCPDSISIQEFMTRALTKAFDESITSSEGVAERWNRRNRP